MLMSYTVLNASSDYREARLEEEKGNVTIKPLPHSNYSLVIAARKKEGTH